MKNVVKFDRKKLVWKLVEWNVSSILIQFWIELKVQNPIDNFPSNFFKIELVIYFWLDPMNWNLNVQFIGSQLEISFFGWRHQFQWFISRGMQLIKKTPILDDATNFGNLINQSLIEPSPVFWNPILVIHFLLH